MHHLINKFSKAIIATIFLLASSSLLINNHDFSAQAQTDVSLKWQEVTVKAGGFTVLFPGKPKENIESLEAGAAKVHNFFYEFKDSFYEISYTDIPNNLNLAQTNQLLESLRDSAVDKGKLLKERRIRLNGYLGTEIEFVDLTGLTYKLRIYLVNQRLYQQIFGSANPKLILAQDPDRFFNSFKLLTTQEAAKTPTASGNNELAVLLQTAKEQLDRGDFSTALTTLQPALAIARRQNNQQMIAILLNNIGEAYRGQSSYTQALDFFEQSLTTTRKIKNKSQEGIVLNNIGLIYEIQGNYDRALTLFQQALAIHKETKNLDSLGTTLGNIGLIYYDRGQYTQALDSLQQAVKFSTAAKNRSTQSVNLANIGLTYTAIGEYTQALAAFQPALEIAQVSGDKAAIAQILIRTGLVYANQSQHTQALSFYHQGLTVAKEIGDRASQVAALSNIGEVYLNQSQYVQALESYNPALVLVKTLGDPVSAGQILSGIGLAYNYQGKYPQALAAFEQGLAIYKQVGSPVGESRLLNNIGLAYLGQSRYPEAIAAYEQALKIVKTVGDKVAAATTLNNIGLLYQNIGQYDQSLTSLEQALKISQTIGNSSLAGTTLNNIGNVYLRQAEPDRAFKAYEQALAIFQASGNRAGAGTTLANIGEVNRRQGDYASAIAAYEQGLAITRAVNNRAIEGTTLNNIGEVRRLQGNYDQALKYYQQALTILQQVNDRAGEGQILTNIGLTLFKAGKLETAQQSLEKAIATTESLRPGLSDANKVAIFDTQAGIYTILQQILIARNQPEAALKIAERGRARAFLELLAKKIAPRSAESVPLPNIQQIRQIAQQQKATLVEYSLVIDEFKVAGENQYREAEVYIWVVKPTGEIVFRRSDLKPLWQQKNTTLSNLVNNSRQAIPGRSRSSLQQLYQLLIQPIANQLPTNPSARVVFIPQGSLFLVPFPALQQPNGKYLIEQHTILTSPSIQLLAATHRRKIEQKPQSGAMVVGNPTMPKVSPAIGLPPVQLASLPAAELEARAIAPILKTRAITGENATKAAIIAKLPRVRVVHLATHGLLDDERGLGSAIALAPSGKDNGLFTAEEILDLKLNADLVVMSACNTGRGKITGDGIIGLSRAWISAGVSSIIVSLWLVPDESTATLMTNFYQNIHSNPDKAQALRQAMLKTMKQNPNPRDWAAFTLIGEAE